MKRRRKIRYYVQNWNSLNIWWTNGRWAIDIVDGKGGSSSKVCLTLNNAIRNAKRILSLGGIPLISRAKIVKGKRQWMDFRLNKSEIEKFNKGKYITNA
jgi:hypothetical protein